MSRLPHLRQRLQPVVRAWLSLIVLLTASACAPSPATPVARVAPLIDLQAEPSAEGLVFYNWPEDVPQSVLDAFTREYGVEVSYETFESFEEAVENIRAGQVYDVVNLDNRLIPVLVEAGLLAEIDPARVPNFKNIAANFRDLAYDPGNRYTIPYNWGTTGLVFRSDLVAEPVSRWSDLWADRYAGKVSVWEGESREVIGLTLKSLGFSANSEEPAQLEAALQRLLELRPHLRLLQAGPDTLATLLSQGEIVMGMGYAGDVLEARELAAPVEYVLPQEGALLWGENFVIPANSSHKATAEVFLNFILRPEIGAQIANANYYATPNEAAYPFIAADLFSDPIIFPSNESLVNAEIILPLSPDGQRRYAELWARFLAAAP